MNALEFRPDSSRFAPVRRLQTAGTHRGVHRYSMNEALAEIKRLTHKNMKIFAGFFPAELQIIVLKLGFLCRIMSQLRCFASSMPIKFRFLNFF